MLFVSEAVESLAGYFPWWLTLAIFVCAAIGIGQYAVRAYEKINYEIFEWREARKRPADND